MSKFVFDFGLFWAPFWSLLGRLWGAKLAPKSVKKSTSNCKTALGTVLRVLGAIFGLSWAVLGLSWGGLGAGLLRFQALLGLFRAVRAVGVAWGVWG